MEARSVREGQAAVQWLNARGPTMSKDYARSLDKIHHKILQDLVKKPENSFCADCAMRGAPSPFSVPA